MNRLRKDAEAINQSIAELVIFSQGAITWTECWFLSFKEREILTKTLNKYLTAKAGKDADEYL